MKENCVLNSYVPRHLRLGLCASVPSIDCSIEVREPINIVGDSSELVQSRSVLRSFPADEYMSKYRLSQFRLTNLIEAGVPLKVVNINNSNSLTIERLNDICKTLDNAETFVCRSLEQQKEKESWFKLLDSDENVNS